MKNKFLFLSMLLALGCSSSVKNADQDQSQTDDSSMASTPVNNRGFSDGDEQKIETKVESKKTVAQSGATAEKAQQTLSEAIKAQNDEAIYRSSVQVLSINSNDVKAQNALGLYHYKKGRMLAAQYFFSRALVQNPNSSELHNNIGLVHLAQKEDRDAVKSFRKALELDQGNGIAAANLGALYVEQKNFSKAIFALEVATKKNGKDFNTSVNYGIALAATGKASQAKEQYQQAIKMNSTSREAIYNLAVVEIEQLKQYQDGLDHLSKVKFLGVPDSARMRINALENKAKAGLK